VNKIKTRTHIGKRPHRRHVMRRAVANVRYGAAVLVWNWRSLNLVPMTSTTPDGPLFRRHSHGMMIWHWPKLAY